MSTALFAITAIESELYEWPKPPIWNGLHVYDKGALHLVRVTAKAKSDSIVGYGFNGGTAATRPQELFPRYVDMFRPQLIGNDPCDTVNVSRLAENVKIYGPGGFHTQVIAAIAQACMDIRGKIEGKSVQQILGGKQPKVRAYIAGGYYGKDKGLDQLREEMDRNVHEFHATAVKMKIGDREAGLDEDVRRIEAVRKQVGKDVTVMVDANCALTTEAARAYLPALHENRIYWFEEPVGSHDYRGHAEVTTAAKDYGVLVATGENGYHVPHFQALMDCHGADVFNVDAAILPGFDPVMTIIQESRARGIKIAPHGAQDLHVHFADWIDMLEYYPGAVDPLRAELFLPPIHLEKDGTIPVPTSPGLGFEPNRGLLQRYRVQ